MSTETGPHGLPQVPDTSPPPPAPARQPWALGGTATLLHTWPVPVGTASPRSLHGPAKALHSPSPQQSPIDLATPSSSPNNQFRPVLGLQRQMTTSLQPLPLLLIPPGSPLLTSQLQRRRRERRERNERKQGRESTGRKAEGIDGEEGAEREEGERGKEAGRGAGATHLRITEAPALAGPKVPSSGTAAEAQTTPLPCPPGA